MWSDTLIFFNAFLCDRKFRKLQKNSGFDSWDAGLYYKLKRSKIVLRPKSRVFALSDSCMYVTCHWYVCTTCTRTESTSTLHVLVLVRTNVYSMYVMYVRMCVQVPKPRGCTVCYTVLHTTRTKVHVKLHVRTTRVHIFTYM